MKIALAQLNYHIGDFQGNLSKMEDAVRKASEGGADLVVFSELSICGYPPLDLLEREDFINSCRLHIEKLARLADPELGILVGGPEFNPSKEGKLLFNSAYFLNEGRIKQVFRKSLLPTYDIFDEYRYFEPNNEFSVLDLK